MNYGTNVSLITLLVSIWFVAIHSQIMASHLILSHTWETWLLHLCFIFLTAIRKLGSSYSLRLTAKLFICHMFSVWSASTTLLHLICVPTILLQSTVICAIVGKISHVKPWSDMIESKYFIVFTVFSLFLPTLISYLMLWALLAMSFVFLVLLLIEKADTPLSMCYIKLASSFPSPAR